jgi:hypothetical protein
MPIRFQADADLNQIIVTAIVRRFAEIDFRTATAAGLAGINDADVLALTAHDGRVLVDTEKSFAARVSPQPGSGAPRTRRRPSRQPRRRRTAP